MSKQEFTKQQLADWRAFEKVRASGLFNMYDPNATRMTGLSDHRYLFVMENYSALQAAQGGDQ